MKKLKSIEKQVAVGSDDWKWTIYHQTWPSNFRILTFPWKDQWNISRKFSQWEDCPGIEILTNCRILPGE